MTAWDDLARPLPDEEVKHRAGPGGMTFSYVDARAVAQRLDEVLTPANWEFTCSVIPGSEIVKGRLTIRMDGETVREDHGYPNSDRDEEPIKAATSDALKRCAVLFGIGRHLYEDNKPSQPVRNAPQRPAPAPVVRSSTSVPDDPYDELDWDTPKVVEQAGPPPWVCPVHGTVKVVPAGVSSRTGKPYDSFLSCTERDCSEKPPRKRAA